jgi:hypothetical protein
MLNLVQHQLERNKNSIMLIRKEKFHLLDFPALLFRICNPERLSADFKSAVHKVEISNLDQRKIRSK